MIKRRTFLKQSAILAAMASVMPASFYGANGKRQFPKGIQLWTLPKLLDEDLAGTMKLLQSYGYTELELYGPYTFSEASAKERWQSLIPRLGFSGSGYFGKDINEFKTIMDDHGMTAPSAHTDLATLRKGMGRLAESAHILGHNYVTLPAIPAEERASLQDYQWMAEDFNKIGEAAKKEGIKFAYHNHGYGIKPTDTGIVPLEIIINNTDPELVFLEMDIFWTTAGGADPVALLNKYYGRYKMLHVKDMKPKVTFSGDGGDAGQWMELFAHITNAGDGDLNMAEIINTAVDNGVEHFFVEQDLVADPKTAVKKSVDFLKTI